MLNLNSKQLEILARFKRKNEENVQVDQVTRSKNCYSTFWSQQGAQIEIVPRRAGKSFLAKYLAEQLGYFVHDALRGCGCLSHGKEVPLPEGLEFSETYLVVDEFLYLEMVKYQNLLNHPWKGVLLMGSMQY